MSISIISSNRNPQPWLEALNAVDPSVDVQIWPNEKNKADIEFALCWNHPSGILQDYPNLRCVSSMGAGVDHCLNDQYFPKHLPLVRVVDPLLAQSMFEYVCSAAMYYFREFNTYQSLQQQRLWQPQEPKLIKDHTIGIMGLGALGSHCAEKFATMGFNVVGWSRSPKKIKNVTAFVGEKDLNNFLNQVDILVCLLPLTKSTYNILHKNTFNQLKNGAYLINVARGEHLVEDDLIDALSVTKLSGACLDVFRQEPLPEEHPFWGNKKILLTPHCSSVSSPISVAPQIINNYHLMKQGKALLNQVDIQRGY